LPHTPQVFDSLPPLNKVDDAPAQTIVERIPRPVSTGAEMDVDFVRATPHVRLVASTFLLIDFVPDATNIFPEVNLRFERSEFVIHRFCPSAKLRQARMNTGQSEK
jgi:hypothetical protein